MRPESQGASEGNQPILLAAEILSRLQHRQARPEDRRSAEAAEPRLHFTGNCVRQRVRVTGFAISTFRDLPPHCCCKRSACVLRTCQIGRIEVLIEPERRTHLNIPQLPDLVQTSGQTDTPLE